MKKFISIFLAAVLAICTFSTTALADDGQANETVEYTESEISIIARVIFAEAQGESWEGKCAVGEVVLNRYESGLYGKTLTYVTRKKQFCKATERTVKKKKNAAVYAECYRAALYVIENRTLPSNTYYFQKANRKHWGGRPKIMRYGRIGKHTFYTLGEPVLLEQVSPITETSISQ